MKRVSETEDSVQYELPFLEGTVTVEIEKSCLAEMKRLGIDVKGEIASALKEVVDEQREPSYK